MGKSFWCMAAWLVGVLLPHAAAARGIVVNAVGDIMLAGSAAPTFKRLGYDYPFVPTVAEFRKGDITVGNLEAPIARGGREFSAKRYRFRSDPRVAPALRKAGFTLVTLANNHMMDFGSEGLLETLGRLDGEGIGHAGAGSTLDEARRPVIVTVGERRVAFLAYSLTFPTEFYATSATPGTAPGYPGYYGEDIPQAREKADYVIVSFHWGAEGATVPRPYQVVAAHAAIDAGADVVIGHHPHVLQGVERYGKGIIFYSLGNFAFGSMSRTSDRSAIARITLGDGVEEAELIPINVLNREVRFQPRVLAGKEGEAVIARLNRLSLDRGTAISARAGRYLVEMAEEKERVARR